MFVAVACMPADAAAVQRAAAIAGIAAPDAARLLAGTLPRVLVRATDSPGRIVEALEASGFVAFAGDESRVPTDRDRVLARSLELSPLQLVAVDGRGQRHVCPLSAIGVFLRGVRLVESAEAVTSTERKLALGKALLTGGLSITRKVQTTTERVTASKEAFLLIQRNDGGTGILLCEQRLNYQCLGADLQPSTHASFAALAARLRSLAPLAGWDDRITRPGFLAGLPLMSMDPVDLALFLVTEARLRGC